MVSGSTQSETSSHKQTWSIGIDVGTTKIAAALVGLSPDTQPEILGRIRWQHDDVGMPESILDRIQGIIVEVQRKMQNRVGGIDSVGIGLPGQVNFKDGYLQFAPGLKLRNIDIANEIRHRTGMNVFADNDVNCATLCELLFGKGKYQKNFVCIFVGTGIGAGIVVNECIVRGHNFAAGEIGHMKIDFSESARLCTCGRKGCFEEYASARAIVRLARERLFEVRERKEDSGLGELDPDSLTPEHVEKLIAKGDKVTIAFSKQVARNLGLGVANIANIFDPDSIILGGGIIDGFYKHDFFRNYIKSYFNDFVLDTCLNTPLLVSSFSSDSPIIGAASLGPTSSGIFPAWNCHVD